MGRSFTTSSTDSDTPPTNMHDSNPSNICVTVLYETFWFSSGRKRSLRRSDSRKPATGNNFKLNVRQEGLLLQNIRAAKSKRYTCARISSNWSKYVSIDQMAELNFDI
eukprot:764119-Hanusia_phi.AAC.4